MARLALVVILACSHITIATNQDAKARDATVPDEGINLWFKSMTEEYFNTSLTFDNPLPSWLNGTLIHNGAGQFENGKRQVRHIFDGFAKLNSWKFAPPSTAYYSSKFIQSGYYKDSMKSKNIAPYMTFAKPDPAFGIFDEIKALTNGMDDTDVSIVKMQDDLVTLSDMWPMYAVYPNLTTRGRVDPPPPVSSPMASASLSTAHPLPEPGTKNWLTFYTSPNVQSEVVAVRIKSLMDREVIARIPVDFPPYMHSFAVTEKYMIIFVNPVYMDMTKMMATREPASSLTFDPKISTKVHVVDYHTGKVVTLTTDPIFMLHQANAFHISDDVIVADMTTYPDVSSISSFMLSNLRDPKIRDTLTFDSVTVRRYIIDLKSMSVKPHDIPVAKGNEALLKFDFPVYNPKHYCKYYCYIYGISYKSDGVSFANTRIVKKSTCDSAKDLFWHEDNHYPGEPHFIPRPHATAEDDGVLLSVILDGEAEKSYVGVFDAATMKLISKAYTPKHITFPFHGTYFPDF